MDFKTDIPIYLQIVDYAYARILSGEWQPDCRVPSVRELGVQMAVNSHTVLKAYEDLEGHGVIVSRRGMGFFVTPDAPERVNADRREHFFNDTLPGIFTQMRLLGITIDDVVARFSAEDADNDR